MSFVVSAVSWLISPTTLVVLAALSYWLYRVIRARDNQLERVERYSRRANHNSTVIVKAMLRQRLLTDADVKDLDLDDE